MKETLKSKKRRIVLLDTHAILHRAFHAIPDFSTSAGKPTGALYGLAAMVLSIGKELAPDHIIACYDLPGGTFRSAMYGEYKAHRKDLDIGLAAQIDESRALLDALAVPRCEAKGFEADDLLGTFAEVLKKDKQNEIIIASGDMDTLQLVDDKRVQVYTLKKGLNDTVMYDEAAVKARFGFGPELIPDYKGLRGDPSDNIPGIAGIGEKTATTLIMTFGSLEKMYKELKKGDAKFLEAKITPRIVGLLRDGQEEAEFSKTLATIRRDAPIECVLPEGHWLERIDVAAAEAAFNELEFRSLVGRLRALVGAAPTSDAIVAPALPDIDAPELKKLGIAVWLLDSDKTDLDLETILAFAKTRDVDEARTKIFAELERNKLAEVYREIEEPIIPVVDSIRVHGIKVDKKYFEKLSKEYHKVLDDIEQEIYALAGQEFNIKSPKQLSEILFTVLKLPTAGVKKSATGGYSTQADILEKLAESHPIIGKILEYREIQKLLSTYIDVIPALVADDGRLHADFIQAGTTTGRFSSNNPNLQNIPIKSELGRAIRGGFVAEKGWKLCSFDYSQMELRLAAIFSQDPNLIEIFRKGDDVHTAVASRVFKVAMSDVTKEMRRHAKVINFGILYGMGVSSLKKNLGGTQKEAAEFYDNYFDEFKNFKNYLEDTKEFARKHGYTETLFGRRRYFPAINSKVPFMKAMAERTAINAPIQGTLADVIKLAMRFIDERLRAENLADDAHLVLQIHDELVYEVRDSSLEKVSNIIREEMEGVFQKSFLKLTPAVPITVDGGSGDTWQDLK